MPSQGQASRSRREPTPGERDLMTAIGISSVEALDRHLDGLLGAEKRPGEDRLPPQEESHAPTGDVPWWLVGAGFGVGVAISGLLLALSRRSNA